MEIDRSAVSRALAKAIAFKQCGKDAQAEAWVDPLRDRESCQGSVAGPLTRRLATVETPVYRPGYGQP